MVDIQTQVALSASGGVILAVVVALTAFLWQSTKNWQTWVITNALAALVLALGWSLVVYPLDGVPVAPTHQLIVDHWMKALVLSVIFLFGVSPMKMLYLRVDSMVREAKELFGKNHDGNFSRAEIGRKRRWRPVALGIPAFLVLFSVVVFAEFFVRELILPYFHH